MLCVRSASLIRITRTSRAMASSILRKDSAWFSSRVLKLQLVELGQSVDQFGHRRAKALDQFGLGDAAVFHGVVQQRGHQGLCIEFPFGALDRHGDRVGDVGFAAVAHLAQVRLVGKAVGATHLFDITR